MTTKKQEQPADLAAVRETLSFETFGRSLAKARAEGTCVACGLAPGEFRDATSAREWRITALCQRCQDGVFGTEEV